MNVLCACAGTHIKGRPRLGDRPLQMKQALEIASINNIYYPGYLSLPIFWENGYHHSFAVITAPSASGKTALSSSLESEHPLRGTH